MSAPGESADDPLIGQIVDGRYYIRRVIGRGGMGVVYEAEATRLGRRPCALKVLLSEFTRSDTAVARFTREAELAGRVKHPNLVEIFDTGTTTDGRGYLVMELLRGESLDRTLRREGPLPWKRAQHILTQVCGALAIAHAEKIVHRDMKPENCFRSERDGDPDFIKVLDFGIAKLTDTEGEDAPRLTATHAIIGTYAYMAYEQVRGEEVDHRVDIWALGVMLYEMLTGRLPFRGSNQGQIWTAICSYDPEPMRNIATNAAIPEEAEAIVRRALNRDRRRRFPTVEALAQAIASVQFDSISDVAAPLAFPTSSPLPAPSTTFVSGLTAPQERPQLNSRTDPVSPHGLTVMSPEEASQTGEILVHKPHSTTGEERHTEHAAPREVMATALIGPPIVADHVVAHVPTPPISPSRRGGIWLVTGLVVTSTALAIWGSQNSADTPSSDLLATIPPSPTTGLRGEPPPASATPELPPPDPQPVAPGASDLKLPPPPDVSPTAPAPLPVKAAPPTPKKPGLKKSIARYDVRVMHDLNTLRDSSKLATCFGTSTAPLKVDIKVTAATGVASVSLPPLKTDSTLDICIQRAFRGEKFAIGGPGDLDVVAKGYILNKQ